MNANRLLLTGSERKQSGKRIRQVLVGTVALALAMSVQAFDLQGHRGARGHAPENSLPGWLKALEMGVGTIECDLGITRDGVVVVHHDLWLNPNTTRDEKGLWLENRGPAIHDLSFQELQRYDIGRLKPGTDYARSFAGQQAVDGTRIPKLSDLFELLKKPAHAHVRLDCETKVDPTEPSATLEPGAFARKVIQEVRQQGMARRMMIQSFDWRTLMVVQQEAPEIATLYLTSPRTLSKGPQGQPSPWLAGFDIDHHGGSVAKAVHAAGGRLWAPNQTYVTAARVAEAHALGLSVIPWTVNDPALIARLIDMGVDGIISDYPDRVQVEQKRRIGASKPENKLSNEAVQAQ